MKDLMDDVRIRLAKATDEHHQALHHHPQIGLLGSSELTKGGYFRILNSYYAFYKAAEAKRKDLNAWPELSLSKLVYSIEHDIPSGMQQRYGEAVEFSEVRTSLECLGMLYVLHGASFGGRVLAKQVIATLPGVPVHYLRSGVDKKIWNALVHELNEHARDDDDFRVVVLGAQHTFSYFGEWVSYCHS